MSKKGNQVKLWNRNFIFIIIINFLVFLNHLMILSTFPFFVQEIGYSDSVSGACATIFSLVAVICRPFVGWMLDNGKRKTILLIGICGMALMPMGYLLVYTALTSIVLAMVLRMLHGFSLACSNTSTSTIATDIIPKPRFSEGMGMFGMATALATACAPAIGEALMKKGFTVLFPAATVIMVVSMILFACLKTPKADADAAIAGELQRTIRQQEVAQQQGRIKVVEQEQANLAAMKEKEVIATRAEAEKQKRQIEAEADANVRKVSADATVEVAEKEASATKITAEATAEKTRKEGTAVADVTKQKGIKF